VNLASLRAGLATRLATIAGLRTYETIPDNWAPPAAIVGMPSLIAFDYTLARSNDRVVFPVRILVAKATDRSAQERLENYLGSSGSTSVKQAIEADRTLGGAANLTRVLSAQGLGIYDIQGVPYLGAEFTVEVIG